MPAQDMQGTTVFTVNAQQSQVHVFVYKGGTLARFGHNHVMSVQSLSGRVWMHESAARRGFEFSFAVGDLLVDDPDDRRSAGSEFPPEIPQADRDGTRRNMLRDEVLDAEHFPTVTLRSLSIGDPMAASPIIVRVTLKGQSKDIDTTAAVDVAGARLTAKGEFDILQTDFGIKPFSAALGALEVQNRLHVRFAIVADRQ